MQRKINESHLKNFTTVSLIMIAAGFRLDVSYPEIVFARGVKKALAPLKTFFYCYAVRLVIEDKCNLHLYPVFIYSAVITNQDFLVFNPG